jgi:orotidine-5'-phosphate decarboxylase
LSAAFLVVSAFLASAVEMVEALTIVLAVGLTRDWRSAMTGAGVATFALAAIVAALGRPGRDGLADVGAVTGATAPQHLARMRELMPATPFLLPGVGAQGGDVAALAPAFAPGRAAGLVTASRSIAAAHETAGGDPAEAARAEAERLREAAWKLA